MLSLACNDLTSVAAEALAEALAGGALCPGHFKADCQGSRGVLSGALQDKRVTVSGLGFRGSRIPEWSSQAPQPQHSLGRPEMPRPALMSKPRCHLKLHDNSLGPSGTTDRGSVRVPGLTLLS